MPVVINVKCYPDSKTAAEIRTLFCTTYSEKPADKNPLAETNFNDLLAQIAQKAFDEGRRFQLEHKDIEP
ncbi:hypothetical protein [Thiomicrorhabdus indica]|uniref:hypothetical protein n=1 Tax=Thiomicrorhabdus indica TaxID=2267253 RepID=UPI002AA8E338|nr:hypothetical protein [Thiomicrorhabdus indica]